MTSSSKMKIGGFPSKIGLYDPANEKDSCGVGFVANIKGKPSHQIMLDAYHINSRMDHRGGCGFEENTGDGAGILTAFPHSFLCDLATAEGFELPEAGNYAVGNIFLPQNDAERLICKQTIEKVISEEGQTFIAWRTVPVDADNANVGPAARTAQPAIEQLFVGSTASDEKAFERALYIIRRRFTEILRRGLEFSQLLLETRDRPVSLVKLASQRLRVGNEFGDPQGAASPIIRQVFLEGDQVHPIGGVELIGIGCEDLIRQYCAADKASDSDDNGSSDQLCFHDDISGSDSCRCQGFAKSGLTRGARDSGRR